MAVAYYKVPEIKTFKKIKQIRITGLSKQTLFEVININTFVSLGLLIKVNMELLWHHSQNITIYVSPVYLLNYHYKSFD